VANDTPLWQFSRDSDRGLWGWQRFDEDGHALASSDSTFNTQREAIEDAKLQGYVPKPTKRGRTNRW
jgi:hypothetical protein